MPRRRSRGVGSLAGRDGPAGFSPAGRFVDRYEDLARVVPLDHSARSLRDRFLVRDSIRTRISDSRRPRSLAGLRRSPDLRVRATFRSRAMPWANVRTIIEERSLPARAFSCARRVVRREVLFAMGRTGRGARSARRFRRDDSSIRC